MYLPGTKADTLGLGQATVLQDTYGPNETVNYAQCAALIYAEAYGQIEYGVNFTLGNITFLPADTFPKKGITRHLSPDTVKPGDYFWYTEVNFQLVGALVELVTGLTYKDAMDKYIRQPVGITDASFTPVSPHAGPGGWVMASADGYAKLLGKYVSGKLISESTMKVMETKWTKVFNITCFSGGNLPCSRASFAGYGLGMFFFDDPADASVPPIWDSAGSRGMIPYINRRSNHWYLISRQSPLQSKPYPFADLSTWGALWSILLDKKYLETQLTDLYSAVHRNGNKSELSVEKCHVPKC